MRPKPLSLVSAPPQRHLVTCPQCGRPSLHPGPAIAHGTPYVCVDGCWFAWMAARPSTHHDTSNAPDATPPLQTLAGIVARWGSASLALDDPHDNAAALAFHAICRREGGSASPIEVYARLARLGQIAPADGPQDVAFRLARLGLGHAA